MRKPFPRPMPEEAGLFDAATLASNRLRPKSEDKLEVFCDHGILTHEHIVSLPLGPGKIALFSGASCHQRYLSFSLMFHFVL